MNEALPIRPKIHSVSQPLANAHAGMRHVFIRDLTVARNIGVHRHERDMPQRVQINVDLSVAEGSTALNDDLQNVFCYETLANGVRAIAEGPHINLVETLAEEIADFCLSDARVRLVRVRVEKLDVFLDVASVGVEIERAAGE